MSIIGRKGDFTIGGIHYLDLVDSSRAKQITITREAKKRLESSYRDAAKELAEKAEGVGPKSLTRRWAADYKKSIEVTLSAMRSEQYDIISGCMKKAAENGVYIQMSLFDELNKAYSLNMDETFRRVLSGVPQQALNELLSGDIYKDGRGLSKRIWRDSKEFDKDIGYIIDTALGAKKSAVNLAEDLEKYVKEDSRTDFDWGNCYPNLRSKKCSYETQRLARTSITHSYQLATVRGCKDNPFISGIRWMNSNDHDSICELCQERAEADYYGLGPGVYPAGNVPLDHPNGMCTMAPCFAKSMDEIARELRDWADGGDNPKLDRWFEKQKKIDKTGDNGIIKEQGFTPARSIKEAEEYARTTLGVPTVNYKGVDLETANAWNEGLKDSFERFPELKKNFGFVGECHERNKALKPVLRQYYIDEYTKINPNLPVSALEPYADAKTKAAMRSMAVSKDTFAATWSSVDEPFSRFKGITVNRDWGKDSANFVSALQRDEKSKFHPEYCDTIHYVLDHEVGHVLDDLLQIEKMPEIRILFDSRSRSELTSAISEYAWNNDNPDQYSEMIAEGWAEYCNSPMPREVARVIGEAIEREYNIKFVPDSPEAIAYKAKVKEAAKRRGLF